ncbi:MAG: MOSC domain-containing protein [Saprospiraceae bacterium]
MTPRTLSEIWIYPVKSMGGIAMQEAVPEKRGLRYDRRWMLVDKSGRFVSQREIPDMALLGTAIESAFLKVFWKKNPDECILVPLEAGQIETSKISVEVWGDHFTACVFPKHINDWFSNNLRQDLRLVFMTDEDRRPADERYAPPGHEVSFADGFPYLIIGQASLDELNRRLEQALPMNRFRPNFVFTGGKAFEEDSWGHFFINKQPFSGVKSCARCIIPNTDQDTAIRLEEPLKTLASFRKMDNRILFGQNVLWMGEGESLVRVGDLIQV